MPTVTEKPYFAISEPARNPERRPTHEEIEVRAYQLYIERGGTDGSDVDDWLQAERELLEKQPKMSKAAA
jgi:DUF2934 family protein